MTLAAPRSTTSTRERRWAVPCVAGAASLAVNIGLLWLLTSRPQPIVIAEQAPAIQVVWIEPPQPQKPLPEHTADRPTPRQAKPRPRSAPPPRTKALSVVEVAPEPPAPVTTQPDQWALPAAEHAPSRGAGQGERFVRNPFAERPALVLAHQDRLQLTVRDRSLGGRLQAMTKSGICAELRRALGENGSSAEMLLASMQRQGCNQ